VRRYTRIGRLRIFGAPLYVHWSAFVAGAVVLLMSLESLALAAVAVASYFAMLLVHETGHAWFARRQRLRPIAIRLYAIHGTCEFEEPHYAEQDYIVAWGGVLAQLAVALLVLAMHVVFGFGNVDPWGAAVVVLGYVSIGVAAFNLLPAESLDGGKAWRLFPLWYQEWREKQPRRGRRKRGKSRGDGR